MPTRYCNYCKEQTEHIHRKEYPKDMGDFKCKNCGSTSINIQGMHEALM